MTLIVRQQADDDLTAMAAQMAITSPQTTAVRFVDRIQRTFRLLESLPLLGSLAPSWLGLDPVIRFMTMRRYRRVVIVYLPLPDGADILRVVDGTRNLAALLADP